jgi:lipoate-protein ligase A
VEAYWSVKHGLLENVRFGGDFLGNLPVEGLASRLDGLRCERQAVCDALQAADVSVYFDGMDAGALTDLFFA